MSDPRPPKPGDPILTSCPFHEWKRIHWPCGCTTGTWFGPSSPHVRHAVSVPSSAERWIWISPSPSTSWPAGSCHTTCVRSSQSGACPMVKGITSTTKLRLPLRPAVSPASCAAASRGPTATAINAAAATASRTTRAPSRWLPVSGILVVICPVGSREHERTRRRRLRPPRPQLAEAIGEIRHQRRVARVVDHVRQLERVGVLVVELALRGHVLGVPPLRPVHLRERGNLTVPVLLEEVRPPARLGAIEQPHHAAALDAGIRRRPGELGERLRVVDVETEAVLHPRQRRERGVADGQRHAHALLVGALLRLPAVRAPGVPVVRGVDDHRGLVPTDVLQRLDDR